MITIVVPVYNMQDYLPDCLESILQQSLPPYEVIIVDDGSTDNSGKIADNYISSTFRVVHQTNKGLSSARNTGIMNARGDYILFIDSDDMLVETAVKRITDIMAETHADIIAPSLKCFGLNNEEVILMADPKIENFRIGNRVGSSVCIKRDALLAVGGYSPRMIEGYEDLHLIINLLTRGYTIVTISEILWLYRVKEDSMASTAKDHHQKLVDQINRDFPEAQLNF